MGLHRLHETGAPSDAPVSCGTAIRHFWIIWSEVYQKLCHIHWIDLLANVCQLFGLALHADMRGTACFGPNEDIDILIQRCEKRHQFLY